MIIKIKKLFDKLKKFLKKHQGIVLIIGVLVIITGIILFFVLTKNKDKEEKDDGLVATDYLSEVHSPEIQEPEKITEPKNDGYYYNYQSGYKFKIPEGYDVLESGSNVYLRHKDGTQIVVTKTVDTFSDVMYLCDSMMQYVKRMNVLVKDEEKKVTNYGAETKETLSVGPYERVKKEVGEIWCYTDNTGTTKMPECAYFTLMQDNKGIIVMGTNKDKQPSDIFPVMDEVLSTLEPYVPTEDEKNPAVAIATYQSEKDDKNVIAYPADWEIAKNTDGMVYIKAPASTTNVYSGVVIEYFADENKQYVDDMAQFSGQYEKKLMIPTFIQNVSENDFDIEKSVQKMDREAKIGDKKCYKFEILTTLFPLSRGVTNSMGPNREKQKSIRYCFESNGVPCVLNFIVNDSNDCTELINSILEKSTIY